MRKALIAVTAFLLLAAPARADWLQDTLTFQSRLGDPLPLVNAPWVGTHNSFNTTTEPPTLSSRDPNQKLSLTQQLDIGVRSLELDVHNIAGRAIVCHGRGADEGHAGCTTERPFAARLAEIRGWLDAHPSEILLLYLEDHLQGLYDVGAQVLRDGLGDKLYLPPPGGCTQLPHEVTRREIRGAGKQVIVMSNCGEGAAWPSLVFASDERAKYEGGPRDFTERFPACDYSGRFQRFYEDSTRLSATVDQADGKAPAPLTPAITRAMTKCGVDLIGFDQLTADDGRLAATIWSWAPGQPSGSGCVLMRARFKVAPCTVRRRFACRAADGAITVSSRRAIYAKRPKGCRRAIPRTGYEAAKLRQASGGRAVWLKLRV